MTQLKPFDEVVPPPWNLVAQGWWFILKNNPSAKELDEGGFYAPLELEAMRSSSTSHGELQGGLATAMVYRYADSPVGPYDELIVSPGKFTNPVNNKAFLRITRIYVSSERSVYNGRKNWNIPKHLAHFKFTPGPSNSTKIEIFAPTGTGEPDSIAKPFFAATAKPSSWIPSFPYKTSWSPLDLTLVQPPLPEPLTEEQKAMLAAAHENPDTLNTGYPDWSSILPSMVGKMRVCYYEPGLELDGGKEYGDGVGFPKIKPWATGLEWLPGMKLVFPNSKKIDSSSNVKIKDDKKKRQD